MKLSLPLVFGSCTILALVTYITFNNVTSKPNNITSEEVEVIVNQAIANTKGRDNHKYSSDDISSLKNEINDLRFDFLALQQAKKKIQHPPNLELISLKQEISALRKLFEKERIYTPDQIVQTQTKSQEKKRPTTVESIKEEAEALAQKDQERWDLMGNDFQNEIIDEQWSTNTMQKLNEVFESNSNTAIQKASLSQIDCRGTRCLVEVQHKDLSAANAFAKRFPRSISRILPQADFHYENHSDGSISMSMYLVRSNKKQLPQ